jgi:hypothetical protein
MAKSKQKLVIDIHCAGCNKLQGTYESKKEVPKSFICVHCATGQQTVFPAPVSYSRGRNYPQGHFENS